MENPHYCRVFAGASVAGEKNRAGTGTAVGPDLILTCWHVISPAVGICPDEELLPLSLEESVDIECQWPSLENEDEFAVRNRPTELLWHCPKYDLALLRVEVPKSIAEPKAVACRRGPKAHDKWFGEGYAASYSANRQGSKVAMSAKGEAFSWNASQDNIEVTSDAGFSAPDDWQGCSGMGLVVDNRVAAIVISASEAAGALRLKAAVLEKVCIDGAKGLEAYLLPRQAPYRARAIKLAARAITTSDDARSALISAIEQEFEGSVSALSNAELPGDIAAGLISLDCISLLRVIQTAQRESLEDGNINAVKSLTQLCRKALPAVLQQDDPERVAEAVQRQKAGLVKLRSYNPMMVAPIVAAQQHGQYEFGSGGGHHRVGRGQLEAPPEFGMSIGDKNHTDAASSAFAAEMLRGMDENAEKVLARFRRDFKRGLIPEGALPPKAKTETIDNSINNRLETEHRSRRLRYLLMPRPSDELEQKKMEEVAQALTNRYPLLLCLQLSNDEYAAEAELKILNLLVEIEDAETNES